MAWSTPATWVAGAVLTAAQLNAQVRDNLNAAFPLGAPDVAWTGYTPTLTQSATVTKTVTYAKYTRVGRTIIGSVYLTVTGTGTASNAIKVGAPVAAAATGLILGPAYVFDTSAALLYTAVATLSSTTEIQMLGTVNGAATPVLGALGFTAALASGDLVLVNFQYEAAT